MFVLRRLFFQIDPESDVVAFRLFPSLKNPRPKAWDFFIDSLDQSFATTRYLSAL